MTTDAPRDRFQVLSLDGGGILGIFTAALLAGLERDLGRPVLGHFDLVVWGHLRAALSPLASELAWRPGRSRTCMCRR